jgi:hypothetical protein
MSPRVLADTEVRTCNPATWQNKYTAQMLHVWVVPYPGGVFSDDLSAAATSYAVQAVLAGQSAQS